MRAFAILILLSAVSLFAEEAKSIASSLIGKDLKGWVVTGETNDWTVEKGVLSCESAKGSWLRTEKEYADFVLKLEYRLSPGANSGVSIRCPAKGDPAHDGLEVQLLDDGSSLYKNVEPEQRTGAIYMQAASRTNARAALPAGEWNRCEISCIGAEVVVRINDVEVNRVNLWAFKTGRDGRSALKDRPLNGVIALEARNGRVDFRKITIGQE